MIPPFLLLGIWRMSRNINIVTNKVIIVVVVMIVVMVVVAFLPRTKVLQPPPAIQHDHEINCRPHSTGRKYYSPSTMKNTSNNNDNTNTITLVISLPSSKTCSIHSLSEVQFNKNHIEPQQSKTFIIVWISRMTHYDRNQYPPPSFLTALEDQINDFSLTPSLILSPS